MVTYFYYNNSKDKIKYPSKNSLKISVVDIKQDRMSKNSWNGAEGALISGRCKFWHFIFYKSIFSKIS